MVVEQGRRPGVGHRPVHQSRSIKQGMKTPTATRTFLFLLLLRTVVDFVDSHDLFIYFCGGGTRQDGRSSSLTF